MKVLNKSKKELPVRIRDRYGKLYTIFIQPGKSTDLEPSQISVNVREYLKAGILVEVKEDEDDFILPTPKIAVAPIAKPVEDVVESVCCNIPETTEEVKNDTENVNENLNNEEAGTEESTETIVTNLSTTADESLASDVNESSSGVFVCPICNGEYATQRGLSMHMQKSHPKTN